MNRSMVGALSIVFLLIGCSATQAPSPQMNFNHIHSSNFSPISRFYCEKGRWPKDMEELIGYANDRDINAPLGFYQDPHFSIPREVELFILYTTKSSGIESKEAVSFKAPPCDSGKESGIVDLAAGQVKFPLPKGFRMLSIKEIEKRYAQPPFPDFVYLHDQTDALISLRFGHVSYDNSSAELKLNELVQSYSKSTPGIVWKDKEVVNKDGQPWIKLAMEGDSDIGRLYSQMMFTSFKGRAFSLYFVTPIDKLSLIKQTFDDTFNALKVSPRNETILVENQNDNAKRAAVSIERVNQSSIRLRDVLIQYPSDSWEIVKEEESRGIPSVDFVFKSSEGMMKATVQVLPSVVQEDPYLEVVTRGMHDIYKDLKSRQIITKTFSGQNFRCRQNEAILKGQLPFMIETCITSTRLKSIMIILGSSLNLYNNNTKEYEQLLSGIELGD